MEFRWHFILQNLISLLWAVISLLVFIFIYRHVSVVNGWTLESILLLTAVFFFVDRLFDSFFFTNFYNLTTIVNSGDLDYVLTKPLSSQFLVSLRYFSFSTVFSNLSMLILIGYLLQRYFSPVSWWQIISFIFLIVCGLMIIYSLWFMTLLPVFWWGRVDNLHYLFSPLYQLCRIPIDITGPFFKAFFTYLIPLGFVATIPVKAVLGHISFGLLFYGFTISLVLIYLSHLTWRFSLRHYGSASS